MTRPLTVYVALTALTLALFAIWPSLDLFIAHLFYDRGGFIGRESLERAPSGRAMVFLIATMVIGPGLIVNLGLKDHWHRPRPNQTQDFNGNEPFRPWYVDDGACKKNCSFVSGEAATGFWMVAPASVLPPPWRGPAMIAAFAFGFGASLLRMAFGGHYLSDVILGGLVALIVIEITRRLLWPGDAGDQ
jgi:lipid A 4'-phosphatase